MNITDLGLAIAVLPELATRTVRAVQWNYRDLVAHLTGGPDPFEMDGMLEPLEPWVSGRRALEFTMLMRSHQEFHEDYHMVMDHAAPEIDNPQHAMDIIMALASMLNHVVDDDEIEMFGQSLLEAEARAS